jgi:hypothetical protein
MAAKEPPPADPRSWAPYADADERAVRRQEERALRRQEEHAVREDEQAVRQEEATLPSPGLLGPRYLAYLAGLVVLVGLFERSDLLKPVGIYALVAATALLTAAGVGLALRLVPEPAESPLAASHYLVPVMAVVVGGAVSVLVNDWRLHVGSQVLMGAAIFSASYVTLERFRSRRRPGHDFLQDAALILVLLGAYVAILAGVTSLSLRLFLIFMTTLVAAYENLARASSNYGRALVGGVIVAQVVTAIAFGLISYQLLDVARLATILLVAWYVNRGMGYHVLEGTMAPGIFVEYAVGAVVCVALIATAILTH